MFLLPRYSVIYSVIENQVSENFELYESVAFRCTVSDNLPIKQCCHNLLCQDDIADTALLFHLEAISVLGVANSIIIVF